MHQADSEGVAPRLGSFQQIAVILGRMGLA